MNKNLHRNIVIAMMIATLGSTAAFAAEPEAAGGADKGKAESDKVVIAPAATAPTVRPVDVTPALREELARQIAAESEKAAKKRAAKKEADPVIVVGRVAPDQTVELTLPKTVQMALDYNRDIRVAHYDLKSAEYYINEMKAGKMPQFSYTFDATRARNAGGRVTAGSRDSVNNTFGNGLSVNIPLYTGGRVEGQIAVAKLGKTSAQEEILRVEQATKLSAVQAYFGLLAYEELQDVYHEAVTNMQGHVDNVTAQYNVGTVAKLDVLTSNVSLADAKTNAVTADNNVAIAEANLNNILGLPLQTKLQLVDHHLPFESYNISLQEALDYAMTYRPEVLQAALSVRQAEENIGIANAGNMPTVSVGASNDWSDDTFPGAGNSSWRVTGGVSFNFYDGGATNARVQQAKQALLAARETEQQTREAVQLAVKQAYLNIRSAAQRVEASQSSVAEAEESFKIARVRYQAGVGINLDVLDAQLNLNQAQTNYIQALYDYNVGIAQLEQAMGVDVRSGVVIPSMDAGANAAKK